MGASRDVALSNYFSSLHLNSSYLGCQQFVTTPTINIYTKGVNDHMAVEEANTIEETCRKALIKHSALRSREKIGMEFISTFS